MKYERWISFCFDHPVSTGNAWYWVTEFEKVSPKVSIELLTRLFLSPTESLNNFSLAQVNQGLWLLISSSSPYSHTDAFFAEEVAWEKRSHCILSIWNLFYEYFEKKCTPKLSHLNTQTSASTTNKNPLNSICYMFWDLIPWHPDRPNYQVSLAYLEVMEKILFSKNEACVESALHGLGHSYANFPDRVENVINRFLLSKEWIREDLKEYALRAKIGDIL